ncbi:MAG: iron-containing alcohol dehydrogenase [Candidatus Woesearchaeota archaeon]
MRIIVNLFNKNTFFGENFREDIFEIFQNNKLSNKNVILFLGEKHFKESSLYDYFCEVQKELRNKTICKINITENPRIVEIKSLKDRVKITDNTIIVSIGGGSVIDSAKLLNHLLENKLIHLSISTNFGSGTNYSPFIIYDNYEFKIGVYDEESSPDIVYYNDKILRNLPFNLKINGALDILTHSIESYLSKSANKQTKICALKATRKLLEYIKSNYNNSENVINSEILSIFSEKQGLVLFPHAAGHYLTYMKKVKHPLATYYYLETYLDFLKENNNQIPEIFLETLALINKNLKIDYEFKWNEKDCKNSLMLIKKYMHFIFENNPFELNDELYIEILKRSNQKWMKSN